MAGGEQPRVEAEAVPERHNGVELSTIILSLWDLGLFSLLLRIHTRTSQIITNARSTALLRANATFLPSFELFQGKWFSWCGEMISRVCFLGCWQNLDEDKESIFSLIYSFRDVRDFFFFYLSMTRRIKLCFSRKMVEFEKNQLLSFEESFMITWVIFNVIHLW